MLKSLTFLFSLVVFVSGTALSSFAVTSFESINRQFFSQNAEGIRLYQIECFQKVESLSAFGKFTVNVPAGSFDSGGETFQTTFYLLSVGSFPDAEGKYTTEVFPREETVTSFTAGADSSRCEAVSKTAEYEKIAAWSNSIQCLWQIEADGDYNSFSMRVGVFTSS